MRKIITMMVGNQGRELQTDHTGMRDDLGNLGMAGALTSYTVNWFWALLSSR